MKIPTHLAGHRAQGMVRDSLIAQYEIGTHKNFTYLLIDWPNKMAIVVDPHRGLEPVLADLEAHSLTLTGILLTHTHWDHIAGLPELLARNPDLAIHVHPNEIHRLDEATRKNTIPTHEGDLVPLGPFIWTALHTPGHSAGALSYFLQGRSATETSFLLTGDTVFIRRTGRTDFPTGNTAQMFGSLQRIASFPKETVLLVGHHYAPEVATTLEEELRTSPPFQCKSVEELQHYYETR